jgi:putative transposase
MDVEDIIKRSGKGRFFRSTRKLNQAQLVSHITQRAAGREPLFVESSFILGLISDDHSAARRTYKLLLQQACGLKIDEVLEAEGAINRLQEKLKKLVPTVWKGITRGRLGNPKGIDLLDSEELSRRIEALKVKGRLSRVESRKARKYLIEQLIARGFKRNEIANRLGVSVKTVYNYLN